MSYVMTHFILSCTRISYCQSALKKRKFAKVSIDYWNHQRRNRSWEKERKMVYICCFGVIIFCTLCGTWFQCMFGYVCALCVLRWCCSRLSLQYHIIDVGKSECVSLRRPVKTMLLQMWAWIELSLSFEPFFMVFSLIVNSAMCIYMLFSASSFLFRC